MTQKKLIRELMETANELRTIMNEMKEGLALDEILDLDEEEFNFITDFFRDYNSSYSLSLAYPESLWKLTAENAGLKTDGKDRLQLAKELFSNPPLSEKEENKEKKENLASQL